MRGQQDVFERFALPLEAQTLLALQWPDFLLQRGDDTLHLYTIISVDGNFRDVRCIRILVVAGGNATTVVFWQGTTPLGVLGTGVENIFKQTNIAVDVASATRERQRYLNLARRAEQGLM